MSRYQSSMRMGALNLLVLVIALCLMVLSVLSLVTARADSALVDRREMTVEETYAEEMAGQNFLRLMDKKLASSREIGIATDTLVSTMEAAVPLLANDAVGYIKEWYPDVQLDAEGSVIGKEEIAEAMGVSAVYDEVCGLPLASDSELVHVADPLDGEDQAAGGVQRKLSADSDSALKDQSEHVAGSEFVPSAQSGPAVEVIEELPVTKGDPGDQFDEVVTLEEYPASLIDTELYSKYTQKVAEAIRPCVAGIRVTFTSSSGHVLNCLIGLNGDATYTIFKWQSAKFWDETQNGEVLWMG